MTHHQQSDESPQDGYAKQASLQSGGTSLESSQPSVLGQIITTAQDEQVPFHSVMNRLEAALFNNIKAFIHLCTQ